MESNSKLCLIVDAYSSGKFLSLELKKYKYDSIHVQSRPEILEHDLASFNPLNFVKNIIHNGNIEETLKHLSEFNISLVMAGSEPGVELADLLSENMGLPSNGTMLSKARRNKFEMGEVLKKSGIRAINQIKSRNLDEILSWSIYRCKWPVVLKPVDSAGTDNVVFCESEGEVISAFQRIIGSKNRMGQQNSEVLAQEFIEGTEYLINTVSRQGKHYIAEIWKSRKRRVPSAAYINDMKELLPFNGSVQLELRSYIFNVLDALRIQFGVANSDVMMTEAGPILLETAARLPGSIIPAAVSKCLEFNIVELAVDSYLKPEKFFQKLDTPYSLHKNVFYVSLISQQDGILKSISKIDEIRKLPSFGDIHLSINTGERIRKTIDFFTIPGFVYLIHEDFNVLKQDYYAIRNLEENGLYEIT